jgi:hypothetical protein
MIYAFPILLLLVGIGYWIFQSYRRKRRPKFIDLGFAFLAVVLIYGIIPGFGFLLAQLGIGEILDSRLSNGFDLIVVESVQVIYLFFTIGFALAYVAVRRFSFARQDHRAEARRASRWLAPLAFILQVTVSLSPVLLGADVGSDYISSYTALRSAPIIVQQLSSVATQVSFASLVAIIVFAVAAWPSGHLRVAALIGCYLVYATLASGSRTTAFLCFFAYIVAASIYVRRLAMASIVATGVCALSLFMIAGLFRDQVTGSYLGLLQSGEFTSLFINAIDLKDRLDSGYSVDSRFAFYLVDLARIMPSQLSGGEKLDPATWYVQTFYPQYYEAGGGLAFGAIAESVIGFGAAEAAIRGALLGLLFAWVANHLIEGSSSPARVFVYVWLVVVSYQSLRDTTFSLFARSLYHLLPILLLLWLAKPTRRGTHPRASVLPNRAESAP